MRRDIQIIFQDPYASLNPRMTVRDIITEGWKVHSDLVPRNQREQRATELLGPALDRAFTGLPASDDETKVEPLHDVRIRAKRLRYALELLRPVLGERYRPLRKPCKQIQRALGDHHDEAVLHDLFGRQAERLDALGLPTLAETLSALARRSLERRGDAYERALPALERFEPTRYRDALQVDSPDASASPLAPPSGES